MTHEIANHTGEFKKESWVITVIGMGLIGGSMAMILKEKGMVKKLIAVDSNHIHLQQALQTGLTDEIATLEDGVLQADLIILSVPVNIALNLLPNIMPLLQQQVLMDVGSTKNAICSLAETLPNRHRFVATHPMWGTEFSGPLAAQSDAFKNRAVVICNREASASDAIEMVESVYKNLGMHFLNMNADEHDVHAAYISHVSHISSFALANTVLEKEKEADKIFEMASGGFESTVRLAKSNVDMWLPILMQNRENVLDVLNEHISQLKKFKACLEKENETYLAELISNANTIKRILK